MEFTESRTEQIPVQLENGAIIRIEVSNLGREDVGFDVQLVAGFLARVNLSESS